jgi:hypothetical protein
MIASKQKMQRKMRRKELLKFLLSGRVLDGVKRRAAAKKSKKSRVEQGSINL